VHIIFLRAERRLRPYTGGVTDLGSKLRDHIGVHQNTVLPRAYKITGEYDYLLVAYTLEDRGRKELLNWLANADLPVDGRPVVIRCRIPDTEASPEVRPLSVPARQLATALFRNAVGADDFLASELPELQRLRNGKQGIEDLEAQMARLSSRARSILESVGVQEGDPLPVDLRELGLGVTWELSEDLNAVFLRLQPKSLLERSQLLQVIRARTSAREVGERHEIIFDWYTSDQEEVMGIARFLDYRELERFLYHVRPHCARTQFHMILEPIAAIPNLSAKERCLPCVYAADPSLEHGELDCGTCARYPRYWAEVPSRKVLIDRRDEQPLRRSCTIGILDLSLSRGAATNLAAVGLLREELSKEEGRYLEGLWKVLESRQAQVDVLVFPEYSVPYGMAIKLLSRLQQDPGRAGRLVVLGSHFSRDAANVAPIAWVDESGIEVYLQAKRRRSKQELDAKILKRMGDASYLFRTPFGNVTVAICSDVYGRGDRDQAWYVDADLVVVPAFHPGGENSLPDHLRKESVFSSRAVAFANGAESSRNKRADSRLLNFGARKKPLEIGRVALGLCSGVLRTYEIDIVANDERRGRDRATRMPRGVIPIHADEWLASASERTRAHIESVMMQIQDAAGLREWSGVLADHLCVDWSGAREFWDSRSRGEENTRGAAAWAR